MTRGPASGRASLLRLVEADIVCQSPRWTSKLGSGRQETRAPGAARSLPSEVKGAGRHHPGKLSHPQRMEGAGDLDSMPRAGPMVLARHCAC